MPPRKKSHRGKPRSKTNGQAIDTTKLNAQLTSVNLRISHVTADGNCLFRAVADQLEGNEEEHLKYRKMVVDYIESHREEYEPFLEDEVPFDVYCKSMRETGTWAGHMELQAISLVTHTNICIHRILSPRWHIHNFRSAETCCIHLSYHNGEHYNSVRRKDDNGEGPAKSIVLESAGKDKRHGMTEPARQGHLSGDARKVDMEQLSSHNYEKLLERGSEDCNEESFQANLSTESWTHGKGKGKYDRDLVAQGNCKDPISTDQEAWQNDGEEHTNEKPLQGIQKVARNKACPCGSKKKFKACCGAVIQNTQMIASSNVELSNKEREKKLKNTQATGKTKPATKPNDLPDMGYLCI